MYLSNSKLQDYKIANDWAFNETQKAFGSKISDPERWAFVSKRYDNTKRLYEGAINEFIANELKSEADSIAHNKAWAELEAAEASLSDSEREKLRKQRDQNEIDNLY